MFSDLNHEHVKVHSAELHRRAELHRLAAEAGASKRDAGPASPSRLHLGGLANGIRTTVTGVGAVAHRTWAFASKAYRT